MKESKKMGNRLNVFISYRRTDKDFAGRVHDNLQYDFEVFFDKEGGIDSGADFPKAIEEGIKSSDVVLMIIGKSCCQEFKAKADKTDFVVEEIALAKEVGSSIIPILMEEVDFPSCFPERLEFVKKLNAFEFGRNSFSIYLNELKKKIEGKTKKISPLKSQTFVQEVVKYVERERLVVLFSQEFTNISNYYEAIKSEIASRFSNAFYVVSVPSFVDEPHEYFSCIANDCGIECEVKQVGDWQKLMNQRLKASTQPLLLFVTDLEDGDEALDKQFATILRNFKTKYAHFHAVFVGRKELAKLVYGEGSLSPLNTAKELFFPDDGIKLGEPRISQQFQTFGKQREQVCKLLQKPSLGRFSAWSYNQTINQLFWKNLLVRKGNKFVWRGEVTKAIAKEVLGCDEDIE